ncbi:response regulator [bacterium]|nr:response regulator [bacterium]
MEKSKILLVDDDVDFVAATSTILQNKGYEVYKAYSGKEARQVLKKKKPDMIILDVMLPDQDGFSICTEFKEMTEFFDIPILILTSLNIKDSKDKYAEKIALFHKANAFAEKPISPEELLAKVYLLTTARKFAVGLESGKKKILIIDSDYSFVRNLRTFLEDQNYDVQAADTAKGGDRMARAMEPDLIIIDAILPDRDGFTVAREFKNNVQTANVPIIMATSLDQQFKEPGFGKTIAEKHKIDKYLSKPVDPELLAKDIKEFI